MEQWYKILTCITGMSSVIMFK